MKLLFVINPISGDIDKEPFIDKAIVLCEKYGIEYLLFRTKGKNDELHLKEVISSFQPDKVASVGGDGTTLFTAIALLNTNIPMGIIPLGSANGMAMELSVNPSPINALQDIIMSEMLGDLDMVVVNNKHHSIHIGDVGINAAIINSYEKDTNRGMITYAKYFVEELKQMKTFNCTIEANGKTIKEKGLMVGICNSRKYGTGVPLNITGNPMDGKFEIVIVKNIDVNSLLIAGLSRFNDELNKYQDKTIISTDAAEIHFDKERLLQLDGEIIGKFKHLKIDIIKGAVKLITNKDNIYHFSS